MKFDFIGVPLSIGSAVNGSQYAAEKIFSKMNIDGKILNLNNSKCEKKFNMNNYDSISESVETIYKNVRESMNDNIPFLIGGDHSLSIGSGSASIDKYGDDVLVVWIDAHTDINTEKTTISCNIHGMTNASLMKKIPDLNIKEVNNKLMSENLVFFGARSIDDGEYVILNENNIEYYSVDEMRKYGVANIVRYVCKRKKPKHVHISFDVDGLDPSEFTATGYNIKDGFLVDEVKEIIKTLMQEKQLALFECVEYNPLMDNSNEIDKIIDILISVINNATI